MATIPTTFGSGGSGLAPGGSAGTPSLATVLRDIADDLGALQPEAPAGPDLAPVALTDAGEAWGGGEQALVNQLKAQVNELVTAVNGLRSALAAQAAVELKTVKEG